MPNKNKKLAVILQARLSSTRFPRKVLADLNGKPMLAFQIERIQKAKLVDEIILATTTLEEDNELVLIANKLKIKAVQGDSNNVLSRYTKCLKFTDCQLIMRLTGDCPLIDPGLIDEAISEFKSSDFDYISNCNPPTYPDGLDIEIFKKNILQKTNELATTEYEKEHVTPFIRQSGLFKIGVIKSKNDFQNLRWTVDEPEDLTVIKNIIFEFKDKVEFNWLDIIELNKRKPDLFKLNKNFARNEGAKMSQGSKLWRRSKKIIPGGNMLLSKRSEMFLPDNWPSYFSKAKGCKVWTLEGKELIDVSIMGIGTNSLGYGNDCVDEAVRETINSGNMSTLNCPEEVYLAEKLIKLHPWADMAKFARTGGEANAIAIRIARAAKGKDKVAICGYHGWHDWYLATNLKNENGLDTHLLSGLKTVGVPKGLQGSVIPFKYNDISELQEIVQNHDLAAIKMEVERNSPPEEDFLNSVRKICDENKILLIFDECTSGFREVLGGHHLKYNVFPDISIFGKALGNGYAITAVIGKAEVMDFSQDTFISSTFWTERIGPTAALATLNEMEKLRSYEKITYLGNYMRQGWQ